VSPSSPLDCPEGRFGPSCTQACDCSGAPCDRVSGQCQCPAGTSGKRCENERHVKRLMSLLWVIETSTTPNSPPSEALAGHKHCFHQACFHREGKCYSCVTSGFLVQCLQMLACHFNMCHGNLLYGIPICVFTVCRVCVTLWLTVLYHTVCLCAVACLTGRFGVGCQLRCLCENSGRCHPVTGRCTCASGWAGHNCMKGKVGVALNTKCDCKDGDGSCDAVTGQCNCEAGYTGTQCYDSMCESPQPKYLISGVCGLFPFSLVLVLRQNNSRLSQSTHLSLPTVLVLICVSECPVGYFGLGCLHHCQCDNKGTCDHVSGACTCLVGWTGTFCEKRIIELLTLWMDMFYCLLRSKGCVCVCVLACPQGFYGLDCQEKCVCVNGGHCSHVTGVCVCPYWTSHTSDSLYNIKHFISYMYYQCVFNIDMIGSLEVSYLFLAACQAGFYGESCSQTCGCHNNGSCYPGSGQCVCTPGWTGPRCLQGECGQGE
uniref:EGF-like domain-containing protein n=1 Tax=Hucho hucho TaxID=62062 RepID=A0A4W5RH13_9TELE